MKPTDEEIVRCLQGLEREALKKAQKREDRKLLDMSPVERTQQVYSVYRCVLEDARKRGLIDENYVGSTCKFCGKDCKDMVVCDCCVDVLASIVVSGTEG